MVLIFFLLTCFFSLFGVDLIFNTQDFPPFTYQIDGKNEGPAVDIINSVCKEAGLTCTIQLLPWGRAQEEVKTGKAQALFLIGWNKERGETMNFSPPLLNTEYGIFVTDDNPLIYSSPEQLKGYTIGVYGPSNTSKSLEELKTKVTDISIDMTPDDESAFKKLGMKRLKAVYSNKHVGNAMIKKLGLNNIKYVGADKKLKYYIGFSKQYTDKALFDKFVAAFKALYNKGEIQKILTQHQMDAAKLE